MKSFEVIDNKAQISIDIKCYSESVVSKVLYWLSKDFIVSEHNKDSIRYVQLESTSTECDWSKIKSEISTMLIDFRMRENIEKQTKDIRTILYLKAFANLSE